jgi:hypothetical protein
MELYAEQVGSGWRICFVLAGCSGIIAYPSSDIKKKCFSSRTSYPS